MFEGLTDRELMVAVYFSLGKNQRFISAAPDNFEELNFVERLDHIAWKDKKLGELSRAELMAVLEHVEALTTHSPNPRVN